VLRFAERQRNLGRSSTLDNQIRTTALSQLPFSGLCPELLGHGGEVGADDIAGGGLDVLDRQLAVILEHAHGLA
jgi:hypothetical protein